MTLLRMKKPVTAGEARQFAEELAARGYRRTSNKHGIVSRIDRPDWVQVLADDLGRSPAELYAKGAKEPESRWKDYYRRILSKDRVTLGADAARFVPGSNWDDCGYVEEVPPCS